MSVFSVSDSSCKIRSHGPYGHSAPTASTKEVALTHSHGERVASRSISNATRQATIHALSAVRHVDGGASIDRRRHFRPLWRLPDEADASGLGAKRRTSLTQTGRRKAERAQALPTTVYSSTAGKGLSN